MAAYKITNSPNGLPTETEQCRLTSIKISTFFCWGAIPIDGETDKSLTIATDGRIWFTARNTIAKNQLAEDGIISNIVRSEKRNISKDKAIELLNKAKIVFAEKFNEDQIHVLDAVPDEIVFRYSDGTKIYLKCFTDERISKFYRRVDEAVLIERPFMYDIWDDDDTHDE